MTNPFIKIIEKNGSFGASEPWCGNRAVALLPYIEKNNKRYYLVLENEVNNLFADIYHKSYTCITGGIETEKLADWKKDVQRELLEETGIDITLYDGIISPMGKYYANKSSIKLWYLFVINLTSLNLDINEIYYGKGDSSNFEKGIHGVFIEEHDLLRLNDTLGLAIFGRWQIKKKQLLIQQKELKLKMEHVRHELQHIIDEDLRIAELHKGDK